MEQNINIAELLKDCPKGTKLYSPIFGECELDKVIDGIIYANDNNGNRFGYNSYGQYQNGGECLLFPSKDKRDWGMFKAPQKEQPKFNVGDVVNIEDCTYIVVPNLPYEDENGEELEEEDYEIQIGNANANSNGRVIRISTPEEIAKWNKETLEPNHMHYSKSKRKIEEWINPTDFVIVRGTKTEWCLGVFSHCKTLKEGSLVFNVNGVFYPYCLPYNENTARLIGTTDNYEED